MKYILITKLESAEYVKKYDILVCQLRQSRIKAKQWGILEMSVILQPLDPIFIINTPLGDAQGVISFFVPKNQDDNLRQLIDNAGYCNQFFKLDFDHAEESEIRHIYSINPYIWKGLPFNTREFYTIDKSDFDAQSVMNRLFAIYQQDFTVKYVKGYRGDGSDTGRRALPLEDARLMVNLVSPKSITRFLDPFAGGGGIIHTARRANPAMHLISADIDRTVEPGLKMYANEHHTIDASKLTLATPVDAIVTEVPFSITYMYIIQEALRHLTQLLTDKGQLIIMCHKDQFLMIGSALAGLYPIFYKEIDRKGTPITISYWTKDKELYDSHQDFIQVIRGIV